MIKPWLPLLLAVAGISAAPAKDALLEKALEKAGQNRGQMEKAIADAPAGQKKAMRFLIRHMPERDLQSLAAGYLLDNVAWAYKARETFPWAKQVPEEVFFNDVLPYASLNERRDNWRKDFFNRFSKYVKDAKTQEEALAAVNKHIAAEVNVKYSTKRKKADQSPYESMEQGLASCSGLSILLTNAFRSVGIPSRVAGIPAWTTKRGNHNWVEIWANKDRKWHFTEYYPDEKGLDHGWLLADAAKANGKSVYHSIYASSWKPTGQYFPLVWDWDIKYVPAVNVTERYIRLGGAGGAADADVCELRVHLTRGGERVKAPVVVTQGDVRLGAGSSPRATDDMNRYFTVKARRGQIYQIAWKDPETGKVKRKTVTTPDDKPWLVVDLGAADSGE